MTELLMGFCPGNGRIVTLDRSRSGGVSVTESWHGCVRACSGDRGQARSWLFVSRTSGGRSGWSRQCPINYVCHPRRVSVMLPGDGRER